MLVQFDFSGDLLLFDKHGEANRGRVGPGLVPPHGFCKQHVRSIELLPFHGHPRPRAHSE